MKSWLNGHMVTEGPAPIPASDRGFLLADGLFETFRVVGGEVLQVAAHLQRLRHGLSVLKFDLKMSDDQLIQGLTEVVSENKAGSGIAKAYRHTWQRA